MDSPLSIFLLKPSIKIPRPAMMLRHTKEGLCPKIYIHFHTNHKKSSKLTPNMMPDVVSRDIVKPSHSTPNNHKTSHKLSFFDQMAPSIYIPLLFFYTNKDTETDNLRSSVLKSSLSAALLHYYPLAGRIKDDVTVDCNDDGALLVEARMEVNLSEILKSPDDEILKLLFPDSLYYKDSTLIGPVAVQVTYFQCGGMSIGLCLCHKVLDMASMCSFIKNWASIARILDEKLEVCPEFNIGSLYPPLDLSVLKIELPPLEVKKCPSRRLGFDAQKVTKLKEMMADQVPNPTRVEVVTALLYKSAITAAAKASSSGSLQTTVLQHAMNLRTRIFPPVSEGLTGNLIGYFPVSISEEKYIDLVWIVKEFRKMKTQFSSAYAKACNAKELCSLVVESSKTLRACYDDDEEGYFCSSWCRFPFYESADFGLGKPFWVTSVCSALKNMIIVMDTKGGDGIQAFITLGEDAMAMFELDQELLSFSSINPSVR
ncbi:BAHD acyltransferase At5g47980-like [Euphorbia lathyris]|uniref:BAHD acyltransferase At5g47980-like n=1 Tax=Euphorbia lathyris TaxID=212925 RepID=UPI0033139DF6